MFARTFIRWVVNDSGVEFRQSLRSKTYHNITPCSANKLRKTRNETRIFEEEQHILFNIKIKLLLIERTNQIKNILTNEKIHLMVWAESL